MGWTGKLFGGFLGTLMGGPVGAAIGVVLGHQFDRGLGEARSIPTGDVGRQFFETTFSVMGCVAKSDGRVSEADIEAARSIMRHMRLSESQVQEAIRHFTAGKQASFDLDRTLSELAGAIGRRNDLRRVFMEIQVQAALDSGLPAAARTTLWRVAQGLGLSRVDMAQIEALLRVRQTGARRQQAWRPGGARRELDEAYRILGVTSQTGDAEVKKAYRRLMSEHHPDKLRARGMPESMLPVAEEKTLEIRAAWDKIKAARGLR
jgi:DnaJ like chaperone protein